MSGLFLAAVIGLLGGAPSPASGQEGRAWKIPWGGRIQLSTTLRERSLQRCPVPVNMSEDALLPQPGITSVGPGTECPQCECGSDVLF